jgi:hypothetical protein
MINSALSALQKIPYIDWQSDPGNKAGLFREQEKDCP